MRETSPVVLATYTILATVIVCPAACAKPLPAQKTQSPHIISVTPAEKYILVLSLGAGWNTSYTGLPKVTVTFISSSTHRLEFSLSSSFSTFVVEYRAIQSKATSPTVWKTLKPNSQISPATQTQGKPVASQAFSVLSEVPPKSQGKTEYDLFDVPMSAQGLYRITAFTNVPDARELDGPTNAPKVIRTFALNLRSNSIVVRRTANGFVVANADIGKQVAPLPK